MTIFWVGVAWLAVIVLIVLLWARLPSLDE